MAAPAATDTAPPTAPHGNPTACYGNPRGTPRCRRHLGLGLGFHGMPWRSVEGSVVCRGSFCCRWCHGNDTARREKGQQCTSLPSDTPWTSTGDGRLTYTPIGYITNTPSTHTRPWGVLGQRTVHEASVGCPWNAHGAFVSVSVGGAWGVHG